MRLSNVSSSVNHAITYQRVVSWVTICIFFIKWIVWYYTRSVAVFTDALEGCINILAIFFSWYSIQLSFSPQDENHPYGHGKIEFIASIVEGCLCLIAGVGLILQASQTLFVRKEITHIDWGIGILGAVGIVQLAVGIYYNRIAKSKKYVTLRSSTQHMKVDAYTTVALTVGLIIIYFTKWWWFDALLAIVLSLFIIYNGYKIIRVGISGIMDESDEDLLQELLTIITKNKIDTWVDLHNFRIIKYGSVLHIDAHLTLPWYWSLEKAHDELSHFTTLIKSKYQHPVELFVHTDPCVSVCCASCPLLDCKHRKHTFVKEIKWTVKNIRTDKKHTLEDY